MNSYNQVSEPVRSFFTHVFGWMSVGLATTATTAWYIFYQKPEILVYLMRSPFLQWGLLLLQIGIVFWLSAWLMRMSFATALSAFLLYAILNGIIFSGIFFTYTQQSIVVTCGIAAAMFFFMALFGYVTRMDLTPIGVFGSMVLIGLIITLVINFFLQSDMLELVVSAVGVVLFSAFTAYDIQQLSLFATQLNNSPEQDIRSKVALLGALRLYLDFINLCVMLLTFTGRRRD